MIGPARIATASRSIARSKPSSTLEAERLRVDHVVARRFQHVTLDLAVADDAVVDDDDGAHRFVSFAQAGVVMRSSGLRIFPLGFLGSSSAITT